MTLGSNEIATLQGWQGKTESTIDSVTAAPLAGLSATLDRSDPAPTNGTVVPPLAHWLYFLPRHRQSEIGPDGHAKRGGFLPPVPLPRRMWAGGRLTWEANNPLQVGQVVQRHSRIERVQHKQGRSGELVFVLVQHEIHNERGLAITEEHDIVYRAAPEPGEAPPPPQAATITAPWQRPWLADEVMLFRFSALTFNGHRIHYDRSYVTQTEGYPGLVVHGPLIATLLVDLWRHQHPQATLTHFAFKALRPTFDIHRFAVCGQATGQGQADLWAHDHEGWLTMQAQAQWA
jgi:3-methylfumaryl-CoA hydratase